MPTGTTALGWASRIFDLGSGTMDDVARQVAGGRSVGTSMAGIRVGASIGAARTGWSSVLQSLRHGGSGADAAEGMRHVVDELESVRRLAQGRVAGHVHAASTEADRKSVV